MPAIRARMAALAASFIIATLASWGVTNLTDETRTVIEVWVTHSFDLLLFLGYAVLHPYLQRRTNPTGAITTQAAQKLEAVAEVKPDV